MTPHEPTLEGHDVGRTPAAGYENRMGPDWKPNVYADPIPECARKFAKQTAPAK